MSPKLVSGHCNVSERSSEVIGLGRTVSLAEQPSKNINGHNIVQDSV